ncbi:MAG TPA: aldehyde dehydrogenase [Herpetosiphon sp.]|uniref:Aldehyde dehydrogenase n=1 Tax=Herpetosiphon aurantiacus (strain ATCC 23779 / DSM 785 / 114-95) TaxID=316274 RepID=A9B8E8_HERA2|nr:aldehyde dehydrogenase family protein [Herpetosiphon sp.]ABX06501.1 aldehyde dehydrogenase [Herpetosiphon aurantiacus DSM 785]MCA0354849.1 aldehyde dehydrogenase family protein [Chloroflexota bacterium]HBW50171.1 aldehyde dehydrogenase [Herpetosiphon sp.]
MSDHKVYYNYIGGEWVPARSGKTYENRNPADTRDVIGIFPDSGAEDIADAVAAAKEAYNAWRLVPAPKRGELLYRASQILQERKEQYANDMTREMGKVLAETRGDVQEAIDMGYFMAGEGRRLYGVTTPSELPNKFQMSVRQPLGVCGLITPWNFPMAIPSWKIFPALICGNTVVIKPAEDTPLSTYNFVQALVDAGLPKGVVNIVSGHGPTAGEPLVQHPDVKVISFTGSTEVGRHVSTLCAQQGKHVSLEMGGKNPMIIMDDADLDLVLAGAVWGAFGTTGQRCTATSRIIAHRSIVDELTSRIQAEAKTIQVGNGLLDGMQMGPSINEGQLSVVEKYVKIGREEGAELVLGGERLTDGDLGHGFFHQPTIFGNVKRNMRIAQEEIFGPVVSIIPVDSLEEAIDVANDVPYGLSSSIYTRNVNNAFIAMRDLYTGIVYVNAPTIGAEIHLPFGGTKGTGNGKREGGTQVLDTYSEWKSLYVDYSGGLQRAQIDNAE